MAPTFRPGSLYVMARSFFVRGPLRRGDIVVFDEGGVTYIKRVVATEGDRIALYKARSDGEAEVIRDWQLSLLEKAVVQPWQRNMQIVNYRIPAGYCYVVGDNLNQSEDSRSFGAVPVSAIRGRVLFAPPAEPEETHLCVNPIGARS
jgi:signal peptidase I